jgi:putative membrane protein insertion efficiency factor
MLLRLIQLAGQLPSLGTIALVRLYQHTLSPLIGRQCRFHPTCSNYMIGAVEKHGAMRGTWYGIRRISRCHPWNAGGIDPP